MVTDLKKRGKSVDIDSAQTLRFKKYASYVQELFCDGHIQVHGSVYRTLRSLGLSPVFPNIRALSWWGSDEELSALVAKGSRILSLDISLDLHFPRHITAVELQSLVDRLPVYAPGTEQLHLTHIPGNLSLDAAEP
ncbi:hypothetical protein GLOTRDRAFT_134457 [Gloeophyllum trabeum ATCC 11539]|uniref:Uncharacterized protein n=1 Tax=Gloeophyllum trabeum (strain ATCC 11539 / FP-39264 / Madison 617) TaxID=670483 RepID=S7RC12_GLOTA|nr:uncharacterized protein GLOTRDRAFT_134457 [Gloeophyllum trabeum ATCC 11539]EPQ49924.1 hypothetical protein GLOTRDRAFT_134457 [Gloeophyllum trabeum ATCC 11539]